MSVEGVHLRGEEVVVFGGSVILIIYVSELHVDLDQLENDAAP